MKIYLSHRITTKKKKHHIKGYNEEIRQGSVQDSKLVFNPICINVNWYYIHFKKSDYEEIYIKVSWYFVFLELFSYAKYRDKIVPKLFILLENSKYTKCLQHSMHEDVPENVSEIL